MTKDRKPILQTLTAPEFDGYIAHIHHRSPLDILDALREPGDRITAPTSGKWGYYKSSLLLSSDGRSNGLLLYENLAQRELVRVELLGYRAPTQVPALRRQFKHTCIEVHSRVDCDEPNAFDVWLAALQPIIAHRKLTTTFITGGTGRSLYIGSRNSRARALLYEKGLTDKARHLGRPNWTRLELRVKPDDPESRRQYADLSPLEVWGATRWSREIAALFGEPNLLPRPPHRKWQQSALDEKLDNLVRFYGRSLEQLATRHGGWWPVGPDLLRRLTNQRNS
ncbi:hypothetical protein P3G55_20225 [Leptospira sp. 96542]|nr:hypothetical protein [Leptospira sp. 96542]